MHHCHLLHLQGDIDCDHHEQQVSHASAAVEYRLLHMRCMKEERSINKASYDQPHRPTWPFSVDAPLLQKLHTTHLWRATVDLVLIPSSRNGATGVDYRLTFKAAKSLNSRRLLVKNERDRRRQAGRLKPPLPGTHIHRDIGSIHMHITSFNCDRAFQHSLGFLMLMLALLSTCSPVTFLVSPSL